MFKRQDQSVKFNVCEKVLSGKTMRYRISCSTLCILRFALCSMLSVQLLSCTNVSDVTDPDSREDISGWYKGEGSSSSSSVNATFSSSAATSSSSSDATPSSSSADMAWCETMGNCGTFTDIRDHMVYHWTKIGSQTWMAENLAYLPSVNAIVDSSSTVAKYYVLDYDGTNETDARVTTNYSTYGVLYNWTAASSACPADWHLSTAAEWDTLESYVGGNSTAGLQLKSASGWDAGFGNSNGTDAYGYSALPGAFYKGNDFLIDEDQRKYGRWWTASEYSSIEAYSRTLSYNIATVFPTYHDKFYGYSIRCVHD